MRFYKKCQLVLENGMIIDKNQSRSCNNAFFKSYLASFCLGIEPYILKIEIVSLYLGEAN